MGFQPDPPLANVDYVFFNGSSTVYLESQWVRV